MSRETGEEPAGHPARLLFAPANVGFAFANFRFASANGSRLAHPVSFVISAGRGDDPMAYWLIKTEPDSWSWTQQVEAGKKGTTWNGVRNHVAKQNLKAMQLGDQAFFYHSNEGKEIVGIVEVAKLYYPDPTDESGKFGMVDVRALKALPKPVSLATIKDTPRLKGMILVNNSRLSVQPVTAAEWTIVCGMGGL